MDVYLLTDKEISKLRGTSNSPDLGLLDVPNDIEVQTSGDSTFRNRALYYWSKLYSSQLENGEEYSQLLPAISMNVLNFTLLPSLPGYHNFFVITEGRSRQYILTDHLVLHFLELPKIENPEISRKISRWLLYLKKEGRDDKMLKTLLEDDDDIRLAHERYKQFTNDEDMRRLYLAREKTERDRLYHNNIARREGLKKGREEGIKRGIKEGLKKGLEKGIEKGIEKGELEDKQNVLIRQIELKYGITEKEKSRILSVNDFKKLNSALEAVVLYNDKESALKFL